LASLLGSVPVCWRRSFTRRVAVVDERKKRWGELALPILAGLGGDLRAPTVEPLENSITG
jgi:hypothetical protein